MPTVVLQQVSSEFARRNAGKTLDHPIALRYTQKYLPEVEYEQLASDAKGQDIYVWGAKAERVHQFEKIPFGQSVVLFRRGGLVFKCGVIVRWTYNPSLAESLWGLDTDNKPWSLVFFLTTVRELTIRAAELNKVIGRNSVDNWQGLTAVTSPKADEAIAFVLSKLNDGR